MKMNQVRQRLRPGRPMTMVSLRMPEDVVEELKRIARLLGFSGYEPLIRAYVGQGLRRDLERPANQSPLTAEIAAGRRRRVPRREGKAQ